MLLEGVSENNQIVNEHPAQYQRYQPEIDKPHPVVHHHFATRQDVRITGRELGIGVFVTFAAGFDHVSYIYRRGRVHRRADIVGGMTIHTDRNLFATAFDGPAVIAVLITLDHLGRQTVARRHRRILMTAATGH